jgi:hypothetical protein
MNAFSPDFHHQFIYAAHIEDVTAPQGARRRSAGDKWR